MAEFDFFIAERMTADVVSRNVVALPSWTPDADAQEVVTFALSARRVADWKDLHASLDLSRACVEDLGHPGPHQVYIGKGSIRGCNENCRMEFAPSRGAIRPD